MQTAGLHIVILDQSSRREPFSPALLAEEKSLP
jgi:hypothetical protein